MLSNNLERGHIVSYGETPIYPWSYRKTLFEAYKAAPIIFEKALNKFKKWRNH